MLSFVVQNLDPDRQLAESSFGRPESRLLARQLQEWLEREVSFTRLNTAAVTDYLTRCVTEWGEQQGWAASTEVPSRAQASRKGVPRQGFLDVVFRRDGLPAVAVEIDRGNKKWSLTKLMAEAEVGDCAIWLRWGSRPCPLALPRTVGLAELRVLQHLAAGRKLREFSRP